jgi:hypothetical protein
LTERSHQLIRLLHNLRADEGQRFWIMYPKADEDNYDTGEDLGLIGTEVKISSPMSHNVLTSIEEYVQ